MSNSPAPSATFDGAVQAVAYWGRVIYVGGDFTHALVDGRVIRRDRLAAIDSVTGALLDWAPSADAGVIGIAVDSSGVYVAGDFTTIDLQPRDNLAKLSLGSGTVLPGFRQRIYGHVKTMAVGSGRIYLGGTITAVNKQVRHQVAAFDAQIGELDEAWAPIMVGTVYSLLATPQRVYVGGMFDDVNGALKTQKLAAVRPDTGEPDTSFVSRVHAFAGAMVERAGVLYAGIDGDGGRVTAMHLDGTPLWTVTLDGDIRGIAILDDHIYIGGHFDNVCKTYKVGTIDGKKGSHCLEGSDARVKLAALDFDGVLQPWTANAQGTIGVRALVANPELGQVVAGGFFRSINGADQRRFALFNLF